MNKKTIQNFLMTKFRTFVMQYRLIIIDEIQIGVKEKLIFEDIIKELTSQEILSKGEVDLNEDGSCEIRRINDQYASLTLNAINISNEALSKFDAQRLENILKKVDGSLFYFSDKQHFSLVLTFSNVKSE